MAKKAKDAAKQDDKQLAEAVRASAHQIWQAGLGAFAKAQDEGGKVFSKLVKEGTGLQKRTQKLAESKVTDVAGSVSKMADSVGKQASGSWDKLEQVFEERVSRALARLGVPTLKDIELLNARIDALSKQRNASSTKPVAKTARKPAARKSAVKTSKPTVKPASAVTKKAAPRVKKPAAKRAARTTR